MTAEPALVLDRAAVAYGDVPVLEELTGTVRQGEAVALIGPNGAGKSTLIKAVLGLVPVVRGRIEVLGRPPRHGGTWPTCRRPTLLLPIIASARVMAMWGLRVAARALAAQVTEPSAAG